MTESILLPMTVDLISIINTKLHQILPSGLSGLLLLAAFFKLSDEPYEQSESLIEPEMAGMVVKLGGMVLDNDLCYKFPFFFASFKP